MNKLLNSLKEHYNNKFQEQILEHIPQISSYNSNYYMGVIREKMIARDLIYAISNDDNGTSYYLVRESGNILFAYSLASDDDKIICLD